MPHTAARCDAPVAIEERIVVTLLKLGKLRSAVSSFAGGLRADHAMIQRSQRKYRGTAEGSPLVADVIQKVGMQLMSAYRVMRFLSEVDAKLPAQIASRLIRHLYGSDVHWEADLAPGVMVVHGMGMAISRSARVGPGVTLFQHCTLGEGRHPDTHEVGAPTIEEGAVIGVGAVVIGPVTIGKNSKVMPGCVVVRSVPPGSIVETPPANVRARAVSHDEPAATGDAA
jgi:serine acetyltransferase